jgi:riboflavin kinase/FMN adenylyltransferase
VSLRVVRGAEEWRSDPTLAGRRTTLAIGNFDGVHLGHQELLQLLAGFARQSNALAVALTFDPHPLKVVRPQQAPRLISTLEQRLRWMDELGLEAALVLPFTKETARLEPDEFVGALLVETLRAECIFVGENFRFGHRHAGDVSQLEELGRKHGYRVKIVPPVVLDGEIVSSSAVRRAVTEGRMDMAKRLLGRPFSLTGSIVSGTGTGGRKVVPTLNLGYEQELLPARGVYATETNAGGLWFHSVTNVGVRPTFDGSHVTVESYLFDFSERVTAGNLEVRFWKHLRGEKKFPSAQALKEQIRQDSDRARDYFRDADRVRRPRNTV